MPIIVVHINFGVEPVSPPLHPGKSASAVANGMGLLVRDTGHVAAAEWPRCAYKRAETIASNTRASDCRLLSARPWTASSCGLMLPAGCSSEGRCFGESWAGCRGSVVLAKRCDLRQGSPCCE